jgi:hypothetical protein
MRFPPSLPLLLLSMAATATATAAPATPAVPVQTDAAPGAFDAANAVDSATLDKARGGFLTREGLIVSLGLERLVSINGNIVEQTKLQIGDIGKLARAEAGALPQAVSLATVPLPAAGVASAPPPAAACASVPPPAAGMASVVPPQAAGVASFPPQAAGVASVPSQAGAEASALPPAAGVASVPPQAAGELRLIQNGDVRTVAANAQNLLGGTVIQNTLNDQVIRSQTSINATVNTAGMLRTLNFGTSLNNALLTAVAPR